MANSYNSITERAFRIANMAGTEPNGSPLIDSAVLTEDLFRQALREAVVSERFERTFSLTLTNGKVALPDGIIRSELSSAAITSGDDIGVPTSYEEQFYDFRRAPHVQLNYAAISGNELHFREAGEDAGEFDGALNITTVALPDIPSSASDAISMPETLAELTAAILAKMMRGV